MQDSIRSSAAAQLHQLCVLVPQDKGRSSLLKPLLKLLSDQAAAVVLKLMHGLPTILARLPLSGASLTDFCNALTSAELRFTGNWRLVQALAASFEALGAALGPDAAGDVLIPIAFKYLASGPAAAKQEAAAGLVLLFRRLRREKQRTEVCKLHRLCTCPA